MGTVTRVVMTDDYYGYRFPVPSEYRNDFMASDDDKWRTLETIGISKRHGEDTPLRAWRDAVAVESGFSESEFDLQNGGRALDTGFTDIYVRQFIFYLA